MKKTQVLLIKRLARLGVFDTEPVKYKKENDIIINVEGVEKRVIVDDITDEELSLLIATEQLETTKSIKNMVKYFYVSSLIGVGIWLFLFLLDLGSHM